MKIIYSLMTQILHEWQLTQCKADSIEIIFIISTYPSFKYIRIIYSSHFMWKLENMLQFIRAHRWPLAMIIEVTQFFVAGVFVSGLVCLCFHYTLLSTPYSIFTRLDVWTLYAWQIYPVCVCVLVSFLKSTLSCWFLGYHTIILSTSHYYYDYDCLFWA